jgi:hypothetical protein
MTVETITSGTGVEGAIRRAAASTGVDFGFLLHTARRESGLNPQAKASTSSATGLFQFVDQTWLSTLKRHGANHGLGAYAAQVQTGADGRLHVADPTMRKAVMDLRLDPQASALMAGELAQDHAAWLQAHTGRIPTGGELYAAHVLGPAASAKLSEAAASQPNQRADSLFPQAAEANAGLFYRNGRPVTVAELSANLTRAAAGSGIVAAPETTLATAAASTPDQLRALGLARRLDRVKRDENLVALMNGDTSGTTAGLGGGGLGGSGLGSLIEAQLMSAISAKAKG